MIAPTVKGTQVTSSKSLVLASKAKSDVVGSNNQRVATIIKSQYLSYHLHSQDIKSKVCSIQRIPSTISLDGHLTDEETKAYN